MRDMRYIMSCPSPTEAFEGPSVMIPSIRVARGSARPVISLRRERLIIFLTGGHDHDHVCLFK